MIPKCIIYDKETLYDSALHLKQSRNILAEENILLKSRIMQLEDELARKNKLLNEISPKSGRPSDVKKIHRIKANVR